MNSLNLRAEHQQSQTLSPRLQHAVRLLQMSSLDFAAQVRDTLGRNPFLEPEEGDGEEPEATSLPDAPLESPMGVLDNTEAGAAEGNDRDLWQADGGPGLRRADEGELSALEMMAVETSLNTHLHNQLCLMRLPERTLVLARSLVETLDDDGYLRTPLAELLDLVELEPMPTMTEVDEALRQVQSLEPAGVGARSVAECLLLQLPSIACPGLRGLAQTIITSHLQALANRDMSALSRLLGEPVGRVEEACNHIRRMDPHPGWRVSRSQILYVVPDVIVKKKRGQWTVELNPAVVPKVRLNQVYAHLFQRHRTAQDAELGVQLQEARWTLRNVEQRFATILDVAESIVKRQRNFLEYGPMAMKPLGLREIADEVGIHESTVSRVTNNKFMATPMGVFELKHFFSRAMISANGSACSGTAIRALIQDIIEAENPEHPLSDAEITRQLAQQGLVVARRTVTKYRQMLRIDAVDRRRQGVSV